MKIEVNISGGLERANLCPRPQREATEGGNALSPEP